MVVWVVRGGGGASLVYTGFLKLFSSSYLREIEPHSDSVYTHSGFCLWAQSSSVWPHSGYVLFYSEESLNMSNIRGCRKTNKGETLINMWFEVDLPPGCMCIVRDIQRGGTFSSGDQICQICEKWGCR